MSAFTDEVNRRVEKLSQSCIEHTSTLIELNDQIKILSNNISDPRTQIELIGKLQFMQDQLDKHNREIKETKNQYIEILSKLK